MNPTTPPGGRWNPTPAWGFLLLLLTMGCEDRPTALEPKRAEEEVIDIPLSSVLPEEAGPGEVVHVQIFGSGFEPGDEVGWEMNGQEAPGIVVKETLFVSGGQLMATLSIGVDATLGFHDVVVRRRHRRRGIGTEFFNILPGRGSTVTAQFAFNYDGLRTGSFQVDNTFVLEPDEIFQSSSEWAVTYFNRTMQEQVLLAQQPRADGLFDWMDCSSPGGKVREPGTRTLECWFEFGVDLATWEWEDAYDSFESGDRPADGTGQITFTSVTSDRLVGEFSIEMHDWLDWEGTGETLRVMDGTFDLPVISAHWQEANSGEDLEPGELQKASYEAALLPGTASRARGISDGGFVVGGLRSPFDLSLNESLPWMMDSEGNATAPVTLGRLPPPFDGSLLFANRVNSDGMVVGHAWGDPETGRPTTGFVYDGETARPASTVDGTEYHNRGIDVNSLGQVAGWLSVHASSWPQTTVFTRGAVWLNPLNEEVEPVLLEPLPGHNRSWATMINDRGHVVGMSWDSAGMEEVRDWQQEWGEWSTVRWQIQDDGTLSDPVPVSVAGDHPFKGLYLTADGDLIGRLRTDDPKGDPTVVVRLGSERAFQLGTVPGSDPFNRVYGASASPEGVIRVVGVSRPERSGMMRDVPVLWEVGPDDSVIGPLQLSPPPSRGSAHPLGINAEGWIVGFGWDPGNEAPVIWRPVADAVAASLGMGWSERCSTHRDLRLISRCRSLVRP